MENNQFNRISNELENVYENVNGIMQLRGNSNGSNNFDIRDDYHTIRLYGLPYAATKSDIVRFLNDTKIHNGENGVYLIQDVVGKPLGEGYVQYADKEDYDLALLKDRKYMGTRYIEVTGTNVRQLRKKVMPQDESGEVLMEPVLKIRGLPFAQCDIGTVLHFFGGLQIAPYGVLLVEDRNDNKTGEAFVEFIDLYNAQQGLERHKRLVGKRYIEVYKSSKDAMMLQSGHYEPPTDSYYDRRFRDRSPMRYPGREMIDPYECNYRPISNGRDYTSYRNGPINFSERKIQPLINDVVYRPTTPFSLHMRGLPFGANDSQVKEFFAPIPLANIHIGRRSDGRASGMGNVDFNSMEELEEAMLKDKNTMGHRYVELFKH
ncbi:Nucleolin-like protein mcs94-1 [Intoshia linei]|uniref:Nucleolin-like protein mcs94-1 n=1 Tax=Intoshia linei TaxID=1819745 RepID=A0A177AS80_9BILA|nr:Nucleolin-like protein mcs94-1 [Intoshia linei]